MTSSPAPISDRSFHIVRDVPPTVWAAASVLIVALAILIHAIFPRYEWRTVDRPNGISIIVYDRWTGKFQGGTYRDTGGLDAMSIWTPF